jgi:hypothetical protein
MFPELGNLIKEVVIQRWPSGIPYAVPGRGALQRDLEKPFGRVILAGDYLGERGGLDTATTSGIEAAELASKMLGKGATTTAATRTGPVPRSTARTHPITQSNRRAW